MHEPMATSGCKTRLTGTQLYALARGIKLLHGPEQCCLCGAKCDRTIPADTVIRKTFTAYSMTAGGRYVCAGCAAAHDEAATITLPDGAVRERQKVRNYSWIISRDEAIACTKAHIGILRQACLDPPRPPYVISITSTGQVHVLFRTYPCLGGSVRLAFLDGEPVSFDEPTLSQWLRYMRMAIAAVGKPALTTQLSPVDAARIWEMHGDRAMEAIDNINRAGQSSIARLALFLSPNMKECRSEQVTTIES